MRSRGSRSGSTLVAAIALVVVVSLFLAIATSRLYHGSRALRLRGAEESALHEARGGARMAAERLRRGEPVRPTSLSDEGGELSVRVKGSRIEATYSLSFERDLKVVRWVSVNLDLSDWRED